MIFLRSRLQSNLIDYRTSTFSSIPFILSIVLILFHEENKWWQHDSAVSPRGVLAVPFVSTLLAHSKYQTKSLCLTFFRYFSDYFGFASKATYQHLGLETKVVIHPLVLSLITTVRKKRTHHTFKRYEKEGCLIAYASTSLSSSFFSSSAAASVCSFPLLPFFLQEPVDVSSFLL